MLTDFFVADAADAERLASFEVADRPALSTNNADNAVLADLLEALGQSDEAGALRGEGYLVFSSDSACVFRLPDEFTRALTSLPEHDIAAVCARWAAGQEMSYARVSPADLEAPLLSLQRLAQESNATAKPVLLRTAL